MYVYACVCVCIFLLLSFAFPNNFARKTRLRLSWGQVDADDREHDTILWIMSRLLLPLLVCASVCVCVVARKIGVANAIRLSRFVVHNLRLIYGLSSGLSFAT